MKLTIFFKHLMTVAGVLSLTACAGLFDSDNTPEPKALTQYTPEIKPQLVWKARPGTGTNDAYLKMSPGVNQTALFTTSTTGMVAATNKLDGQLLWKVDLKKPLTTGAGVGAGLVIVGSRHGDVYALSDTTGQMVWSASVPGELIARPVISGKQVIVKAINGELRSLSTQDGHEIWRYKQVEPSLILRGSSAPLPLNNHLYVGFANGSLAKIGLNNGQFYWAEPIAEPQGAFAIQRMIDIDANPIHSGQRLFAATYQGKIASLDKTSGRRLWTHDISSYTGMSADNNTIFISDAKGYVWALGINSGLVNWRQTDLEARILSGPAVMGNYLVVGDKEGYLHWLSKRDGHFAAREFIGAAVYASPVVENNTLYALTANGSLVAYRLS